MRKEFTSFVWMNLYVSAAVSEGSGKNAYKPLLPSMVF